MSQYRVIGIQCDGDNSTCDEQVELTGGARFLDVYREAEEQGWLIQRGRQHRCPKHKNPRTPMTEADWDAWNAVTSRAAR